MADSKTHRIYKGTDANLLQQARVNRQLLSDNLAAFTAEDTTVGAAFLAAYDAEIGAADATTPDGVVVGDVSISKEGVEAELKKAATLVRQLRYYVGEAYPTDPTSRKVFELGKWRRVRRSQPAVHQFLTVLHSIALDHAEKLAGAGFGNDRVAQILTIRDGIAAAGGSLSTQRAARPTTTIGRVAAHNAVYERLRQVNALAGIVYAEDFEMRRQFRFEARVRRRKKKDGGEGEGKG